MSKLSRSRGNLSSQLPIVTLIVQQRAKIRLLVNLLGLLIAIHKLGNSFLIILISSRELEDAKPENKFNELTIN